MSADVKVGVFCASSGGGVGRFGYAHPPSRLDTVVSVVTVKREHTGWTQKASHYQWRSNRVCKACSARWGPSLGGQTNPVWRREGGPFGILHTGPLQPCYALTPLVTTEMSVNHI